MARGLFTWVSEIVPNALDVIEVCGPAKLTELVALNTILFT